MDTSQLNLSQVCLIQSTPQPPDRLIPSYRGRVCNDCQNWVLMGVNPVPSNGRKGRNGKEGAISLEQVNGECQALPPICFPTGVPGELHTMYPMVPAGYRACRLFETAALPSEAAAPVASETT